MTKIEQRIPPLPREEWTDASREVCAFWGEPNAWEEGSKTSIIMTMANHPDLGKAYNVWGKHLLMGNTLSTRALEIIVLRIAAKVKSAYEWHNHVGYGMNAGLTLEDIAAIRDWTPDAPADPRWTETEQAVLVGIEELIGQGTVTSPTWATLSKAYDKRQMMDLVFTIGHYVMTSWALSSFGVPIEGGADAIGFDLRTASGRIPGRTWKPGEDEEWVETRGY